MPVFAVTTLALLLTTFALTSCGFHLRGPVTLAPPLHKLYIHTSTPYSPLTKNLTQALRASGVTVTATSKEAITTLDIISETTNEQLLSVGGTQQTRQYNLILTVTFQVLDAAGRTVLPAQSVTEQRTITIQASQILGGSNETNILYQQMRLAIVNDIMIRLSAENAIKALAKLKP